MPNGFSSSKEEWKRIEAPLLEIDEVLKDYAKRHHMKLTKNIGYPDFQPARFLKWGKDVHRFIEILPENPVIMTFSFWISATLKTSVKRQSLKRAAPFAEIRDNLKELLEEGRKLCESWSEHDLTPI